MKKISIQVSSDDAGDNSATSVTHERHRGGTWHRVDGKDVVTNKDKDAVEFMLRPGDRVVVEGYPGLAPGAAAYDRDQAAAFSPEAQTRLGVDRPGTTSSASRPTQPTGSQSSQSRPVQNPTAVHQQGADTSKPVGQATSRPTSPAPDRGPELNQTDKK